MDELQALWRKASGHETQLVSQSELETAVSRQSSDELDKFRRVIKDEYMITWPALFAMIAGAIWLPDYLIIIIPVIAYFGYMTYFYRQSLQQFTEIHYEDDLKTYLQQSLRFLKSYVRHYKIICWTSGLVGFVAGYLATRYNSDSELSTFVESHLTIFLIGTLLLVVCCLLGIHFYIKHLYQARINRLEELLQEIVR